MKYPNGYRVIQGCPANVAIAPFIELLRRDVGGTVNSVNRTDRAAAILHRHGKHTQREIYDTYPPGTANPPGFSTHEDRSDGDAYGSWARRGQLLPWWCEGWDTDDSEVPAWHRAAARRGWELVGFYHSGVELHHLNFLREPKPRARDLPHVVYLRAVLPRY